MKPTLQHLSAASLRLLCAVFFIFAPSFYLSKLMKNAVIDISGMKFYAYHGCFEEEQAIGTYFIVDAKLTYDAEKAVNTDSVDYAVNYLLVYKTIKKVMDKPQHLIETVAENIIKNVKSEFPEVLTIAVKVCKLNPPLDGKTDFVSVQMEG